MSFINHTTRISDSQDRQVDYQIEQEHIYLLIDQFHLTIEHQNQVYQPHQSQDPHCSSHLTIEPIQKNEHRHSVSTLDFKPLHPSQPVLYPKSNNQVIKPDNLNSILDLMIAFPNSNLSDWFQSVNNPSGGACGETMRKSSLTYYSAIDLELARYLVEALKVERSKEFKIPLNIMRHYKKNAKHLLNC
ncbi:hypothetical protein DFH28DRAFT_1191421 [Melampsora americana]|nr:hypothetical protein DFH28DRAFT_1191421 [Melampsora americana]